VYGRSSWTEVTNRPYDSDDPRYRDPFASNSSGGAGLVSGRIVGLALSGSAIYIGGANGGVFRSGDNGQTWSPLTDKLPTLSVGDLRVAPDGALWLATGESNTGASAYVGSGVYRIANPASGTFAASDRVGGTELESTFIGKIRFDGQGTAYAATSRGLWKHAASTASGAWRRVCIRCPIRSSTASAVPNCSRRTRTSATTWRSSRAASGQRVLVNCAWRDGAAYNGFYYSTDGGETFARVNPTGALNPQDVGPHDVRLRRERRRALRAHRIDDHYSNSNQTALGGVYVSPNGTPAGPWNKIGGSGELAVEGIRAQECRWLQARHPGLVQPVPRGRSRRSVPRVRGPRGNLRDRGRRRALDHDRPLLELRFPLLVVHRFAQHLSGDDASRSTFDRDWERVGVRRKRRRSLSSTGARDGQCQRQRDRLAESEREHPDAAVLLGGGRQSPGRRRGVRRPAGQRRIAPPARRSHRRRRMGSPFGGDGGDTLVDPNDGCRIVGEYVFPGDGSHGELRAIRWHDASDTRHRSPRSVSAIHRAVRARRRQPGALGRGRAVRVAEHERVCDSVGRRLGAAVQQRRRAFKHRWWRASTT
jgi:hypothetical protein